MSLAPSLGLTTPKLWPEQASRKLIAKGLTQEQVESLFPKVVFPENPTYNSYRFFYELEISELPLFIIVLTEYEDAAKILDFIAEYKLTVRIINGRHNSAIQDPDIYVDISRLKKIKFTINTLQIQGGATQGKVYIKTFNSPGTFHFPGAKINHPSLAFTLHPFGREIAFAGGSAGSVGVAGVTTCGGIGSLKRTLGLTADSVISFKIAVPTFPKVDKGLLIEYDKSLAEHTKNILFPFLKRDFSKVVVADEKQNSDLYWALRGGQGSNFGIVLKMTFNIIHVYKTITYAASFGKWNAKKSSAILAYWQKSAPRKNERFNEDINLFNWVSKDRKELGIGIAGIFVVDYSIDGKRFTMDTDAAFEMVRQELKPYLKWEAQITMEESTYQKTIEALASHRTYMPFSKARILFRRDQVDPDIVVNSIENTSSLPGLHMFSMELMGGKISTISPRATAFYPRKSKFTAEMVSYWDSALYTCANTDWVKSLFDKVYNSKRDHVYIGFPINGLPNHLNAYYGKNKKRLQIVKRKYDPLNILRHPTGL